MDYYEELGLRHTATEEEIRKAYRTISKVLHPDLQTDPAARDAASLQMRRLNMIAEVLLDSTRRQEYDRTLRSAAIGPAFTPPGPRAYPGGAVERSPMARWIRRPAVVVAMVIVAGVVATLAIIWSQAGDLIRFQTNSDHSSVAAQTPRKESPGAPQAGASQAGASQPAAENAADPSAAPDSPVSSRHTPAKGAIAEAGRGPEFVPPADQARSAPQSLSPALPSPPAVSAPAPAPVAPPATPLIPAAAASSLQPPGLDGLWVYVPATAAGQRSSTVYAPEYIQLRIRTQSDNLYGEYSARYQVPDRPISSDVSFTFEGRNAAPGQFGWRGSDGSLGTVELKMLDGQSLRVNWRVTSFGTRMGLGAGTAVLIRKLQS